MKKIILITITILLLILPSIIADPEQYLTKGVTRDNSYTQDGNGVWAGRNAILSTRTGDYRSGVLVADLDGDGENEIITVDSTAEELQILNYTVGVGLVLKDAINIGDLSYSTNGNAPFYQTPGLIDYDSDGIIEIIVFNATNAAVYEFDGTTISLNQTTLHGISRPASMSKNYAVYPTIKCAPSNTFADAKAHCITPVQGTNDHRVLQYNLDDNLANTTAISLTGNSDTTPYNTHMADVDNDGYNEVLFRIWDSPNKRIVIDIIDITASGATFSKIVDTTFGGSYNGGDIIISNMDGALSNGREITWAFTSDGTNWQGRTWDFSGTTKSGSYCILGCPEGEAISFNLFLCEDSTYCDFVNQDVCYYIRNAANNDPGENTDTIHCLSRGSGVSNKETTVSNTVNFTVTYPIVHFSRINGNTGLTLPMFLIDSSSVLENSLGGDDNALIPVDFQRTGSLDLIGFDDSNLNYYDDGYTNQNTQIESANIDTGNPVCQNELVTITLELTDQENDIGTCHIREMNANDTQKSIQSNLSFSAPPISLSLNYYADEVGSFPLQFRCKDQYHDSYSVRTYTITVSNQTTACNFKGEGAATQNYVTDEETTNNQNFVNNWNQALEDVGARGQVMKGIIWLLAMMITTAVVAFLAAKNGMEGHANIFLSSAIFTAMLIMGWYLDMIGTVVLVMFGLFLVAAIGLRAFKATQDVTGGS